MIITPEQKGKERADRFMKFSMNVKHTKGKWAGIPFNMQPFQEKDFRKIFGTVDDDGNRTIRTVFKTVARKNGKSEEAAVVALYLLFADREKGAEIYSAAADSDQAAIVFNVASAMVKQSKVLSYRCKILESTRRIIHNNGSFYRVLSADHATKHGFNAHGIIFDELHTQPNRKLWDVLTTSGGTREQPLIYSITTAGSDKKSICYEQYQYAKKILKGVVTDNSFYPIIYELGKDEDWKDKALWFKANPGLGVFRKLSDMEELFNKALIVPAVQNTFRNLFLNQWTSQAVRWINYESWNICKHDFQSVDLKGKMCYAGLDLASTQDLAALVLVFQQGEEYFILPYFWCPEDRVDELYEKGVTYYKAWKDEGFLRVTPGSVIDYRRIRRDILELAKMFDIKEIAFDRWNATEIVQNLEDEDFDMVQFGQGFASMAAPTKELLRLILDKKLKHNNHPVMNWMIDNVVVKTDPAGNMKPDKSKSSEKIDGAVALIMGLGRALVNLNNESVYDRRGILRI